MEDQKMYSIKVVFDNELLCATRSIGVLCLDDEWNAGHSQDVEHAFDEIVMDSIRNSVELVSFEENGQDEVELSFWITKFKNLPLVSETKKIRRIINEFTWKRLSREQKWSLLTSEAQEIAVECCSIKAVEIVSVGHE